MLHSQVKKVQCVLFPESKASNSTAHVHCVAKLKEQCVIFLVLCPSHKLCQLTVTLLVLVLPKYEC